MKYILLIIILIIPYHSFSNEYIIVRVCEAVAGCPVNINTGECPTCINEKRKVERERTLKKKVEITRIKSVNTKIKYRSFLFDCELCFVYLKKWRK